MAKGYMTAMAKIRCNAGAATLPILLPIPHGVSSKNKALLNANDHIPMFNIMPFGVCQRKAAIPPPGNICVPVTPLPWSKPDNKFMITGGAALTKDSCLNCMMGGTIKFQ